MIIEAKAARSRPADGPSAERYALKEAKRPSRTPYGLMLMLIGLGLYLKSIFPGEARQYDQGHRGPDESKADPRVRDLGAVPDADVPAPVEAALPPGHELPSGWKRGPLEAHPEGTTLADAPQIGDPPPHVAPPLWPVALGPYGAAANDNPGGGHLFGPRPSVENPGTQGPGTPANPATPEGPATPGAPAGPGDPQNPVDPNGPGGPDDTLPPACGCGPVPVPATANRAPRVAASVHLADITGCSVLLIGLADLLLHASDPDGDTLSIAGISASSGTIAVSAQGWSYSPEPYFTGPVTLTYEISDGALSVGQFAHFAVLERGVITGTDCDDDLVGTMCADDIEGGPGNDRIEGLGGNDVISGGAGDDFLSGGDGDDIIFGGLGNDLIYGGNGNDQLWGGAGNDRIYGEAGDDIIHGEDGDDFLSGGTGDDVIFGGAGDDVIHGDEGNDVLDGGDGDDIIHGGAGNDVIRDGQGSDEVFGGDGDDYVIAALDAADDLYDGGAGEDTLDYSAASEALVIDLAAGAASGVEIGTDGIVDFETVIAGAGDDIILDGGGSHQLYGGAGDDIMVAALDGADDHYDGGAGEDTLDYSAANEALVIDLTAGAAGGVEIGTDSIVDFETVIAGSGDDIIRDGDGSHQLYGGAGDDIMVAALDGADDHYDGGAGEDTLDYSAAREDLRIDLVSRVASGVEIGTDTITGFETILGGAGNDHFLAGGATVTLGGGEGENIFEFVCAPEESAGQQLAFEILDFKVGDRIRMSKYDLFEKVFDAFEDDFEKIYGEDIDEDDVWIRFRHETDDAYERTIIEADFNRDDIYETTITLQGRHLLVIVETA